MLIATTFATATRISGADSVLQNLQKIGDDLSPILAFRDDIRCDFDFKASPLPIADHDRSGAGVFSRHHFTVHLQRKPPPMSWVDRGSRMPLRCRGSKFAEAAYGWGSELPGDGSQGAGQLSRRIRRDGRHQARYGDSGDQRTGLGRTHEAIGRPRARSGYLLPRSRRADERRLAYNRERALGSRDHGDASCTGPSNGATFHPRGRGADSRYDSVNEALDSASSAQAGTKAAPTRRCTAKTSECVVRSVG